MRDMRAQAGATRFPESYAGGAAGGFVVHLLTNIIDSFFICNNTEMCRNLSMRINFIECKSFSGFHGIKLTYSPQIAVWKFNE